MREACVPYVAQVLGPEIHTLRRSGEGVGGGAGFFPKSGILSSLNPAGPRSAN